MLIKNYRHKLLGNSVYGKCSENRRKHRKVSYVLARNTRLWQPDSSHVGQSTLVRNMLKHRKHLFSLKTDDIIWRYGQAQSTYEGCTGRSVRSITVSDYLDTTVPYIVIFDDMMECEDLGRIVKYLVIFLLQKMT